MTLSQETPFDFSILLATRSRPAQVQRLFESILNTAENPDAIEVVLYIDEDDRPSHSISHSRLALTKLIRPKTTMGGMHRACCEASQGKYIMIAGDDNLFVTAGWDREFARELEGFPGGIGLAYGNDLIQGRNMCTAPFLTRKSCEMMDGICPADYTGEFVDTHILDQFSKLRYWGYDRIVYRDDIVIEHLHHVAGKAPFDETYAAKAPTEENRDLFFRLDPLRVKIARKMVYYLSGGKKK